MRMPDICRKIRWFSSARQDRVAIRNPAPAFMTIQETSSLSRTKAPSLTSTRPATDSPRGTPISAGFHICQSGVSPPETLADYPGEVMQPLYDHPFHEMTCTSTYRGQSQCELAAVLPWTERVLSSAHPASLITENDVVTNAPGSAVGPAPLRLPRLQHRRLFVVPGSESSAHRSGLRFLRDIRIADSRNGW